MQSCQHILLGTFDIIPGSRIRRNYSNKLEDLVGHVPHNPAFFWPRELLSATAIYFLLLFCVYVGGGGGGCTVTYGWRVDILSYKQYCI